MDIRDATTEALEISVLKVSWRRSGTEAMRAIPPPHTINRPYPLMLT
jgi:hypothetical protein